MSWKGIRNRGRPRGTRGGRRKAKDRAVQSHKRNVRPTHSQLLFFPPKNRTCCITGYETLVRDRLVHRDLRPELLVGNDVKSLIVDRARVQRRGRRG